MSGAFTRSVDVFISRNLSPQAQSKMLADTAKAGVASLIQSGRAAPLYQRFVDGREGVSEDAVKPGGVIAYRFEYLAEIVTFALEFLKQRSPRKSGKYRESFYLGLDGKFVPAARFNPATMGSVQECVVGNLAAYSRKIDVQLVGGKRLKFSVPAGLFDDAAKAVRQRFGNMVAVKRVYTMAHPQQYTLKRGKKAGSRVESPALVISVR